MSHKWSTMKSSEFQKCGEILMAPKINGFMMACNFCEDNTFSRMQSFKRHLHQVHGDKIKFPSSDQAEVMVYAVEELVNRTYCGDEDSEESGVADDYLKWSEDDDNVMENDTSFCNKGRPNNERCSDAKGAALANMSILEALEDCDVSLNFVENLDTTIVNENQEEHIENGKRFGATNTEDERDEGMEDVLHNDDDDCDMDSTLLTRIKLDLELCHHEAEVEHNAKSENDQHKTKAEQQERLSVEQDKDHENSQGDKDPNVTVTKDNVNTSLNTLGKSKRSGLKNLLCGLEDLDDVDDLLDNIEDSFMAMPNDNAEKEHTISATSCQNAEEGEDEDMNLIKSILSNGKDSMDEQESQQEAENKITALEMKLMADLDIDENDLKVCLNKDLVEAIETPVPVEKESTSSKTSKSRRKSLKLRQNSQTPKQEKDGNPEDTSPLMDTVKSNKSTPKSRSTVTPTTRTPKINTVLDRDEITTFEENFRELDDNSTSTCVTETPKSKKNMRQPAKETPSTNKSKESESGRISLAINGKIENDENSVAKSRKSMSSNPTSTTPKANKTKEHHTNLLPANEIVDTTKFEDGIKEENSSTLMDSTTNNDPIKPQNKTEICLQSLLEKELDDDDDLDLLINQLETSNSSRDETELVLNKTLNNENISDTLSQGNEKEVEPIKQTDNEEHASIKSINKQREDFEADEDDMAIFNKFIGKENAETEKDLDDFENLLNEDLSKALEQALGEENVELESPEKENIHVKSPINVENQTDEEKETDLSIESKERVNPVSNLASTDNEPTIPEDTEEEKPMPVPHQRSLQLKETIQRKNTTAKCTISNAPQNEYRGKFKNTNRKARSMQNKPILLQENIAPSTNTTNTAVKGSKIQAPLTNKYPNNILKQQNTISQLSRANQNVQKLRSAGPNGALKPLSPEKFNIKQENSPLKQSKCQKTPSSPRNPQMVPQLNLLQFKREVVTPARGFVNTERGERTPLKVEDLFLKQSPKTREKTGEKPETFHTLRTPEQIVLKKSPSECKMNFNQKHLQKTPSPTKLSPSRTTRQKTPMPTQPTPTKDVDNQYFSTPSKTRSLSVKVQRCTTPRIKESSNNVISPTQSSAFTSLTKTSPLSASERKMVSNNFKLPKGITISKVSVSVSPNTYPAMIEVTPSRSNYCKQNFTEHSLKQEILGDNQPQTVESLIKSVPSSITITKRDPTSTSRLRARQASIDIVSGKSIPLSSKTPKPGNLNYRSYAVHRSARKKEVLQKMRHIKKQIFKSIANDSLIESIKSKSPLKRRKRTKIQINNVEILPNIKQEVLTPLLQSSEQSPVQESPKETSPKRLNNDVSLISPKRFKNIPGISTIPMGLQNDAQLKTPTTSSLSPQKEMSCAELKTPPPPVEKVDGTGSKTPKGSPRSKTPKGSPRVKSPNGSPESKTPKRSLRPKTPKRSPVSKTPKVSKTPTTASSFDNTDSATIHKTPTTSSAPVKKRSSTLKRVATSPLQNEVQSTKRARKPPQQKKEKETKAMELEATQLGLSDSVVDFLQRDLKANRINVDSLLSEDMPVDDTTPDETCDFDAVKHVEKNGSSGEQSEQENIDNKTDGSLEKATDIAENNDNAKKDEFDKDNNAKTEVNIINNSNEMIKDVETEAKDVIAKDNNVKNDSKDSFVKKSPEKENKATEPELAILNELLEQVDNEQNPVEPSTEDSNTKIENEAKPSIQLVEDYDETKDLALLEKVGLKIIKVPDANEDQTIEEYEETERLAQRFANICKTLPIIFSSRQAVTDVTFKLLLANVNQVLKIELTLSDVKRLVNLIVMWYANCYNRKLIEKTVLSEVTNKFLLMFHFISKTIKRIYYCEFCEEHFNTENRYYKHRIIHTGARHPFECKSCHEGFIRVNKLRIHEVTCKKELRVMVKNEKYLQSKIVAKPIDNGCNGNLKTVYNCAKCDLSFTTEADIKSHMAVCNRSVRKQPKAYTPRPKAKSEPYTKD